jgi:hypothetical protein
MTNMNIPPPPDPMQEQQRRWEEIDAGQIAWVIKKLKAIEVAVQRDTVAEFGPTPLEVIQHRTDNAVRIYCANYLKK